MDKKQKIKQEINNWLDDLSREEFINILKEAGFKVEDGDGKLIFENKRKIELINGEANCCFIKGERNPCGCGSNLYHTQSDGKTVFCVCNVCGKDIYEFKEYYEFKEWEYE